MRLQTGTETGSRETSASGSASGSPAGSPGTSPTGSRTGTQAGADAVERAYVLVRQRSSDGANDGVDAFSLTPPSVAGSEFSRFEVTEGRNTADKVAALEARIKSLEAQQDNRDPKDLSREVAELKEANTLWNRTCSLFNRATMISFAVYGTWQLCNFVVQTMNPEEPQEYTGFTDCMRTCAARSLANTLDRPAITYAP